MLVVHADWFFEYKVNYEAVILALRHRQPRKCSVQSFPQLIFHCESIKAPRCYGSHWRIQPHK
jgi:hypothetical protein